MKAEISIVSLHPRVPFGIARGVQHSVENVLLRIEKEGFEAWGEASPRAYYGETAADVAAKLHSIIPWLSGLRWGSKIQIAEIWAEAKTRLMPSYAALCALDVALWNWLARREGVGLSELLWGAPGRPTKSFVTVGLAPAEIYEVLLRDVAEFPRVKLKSESSADLEPVRLARKILKGELALDANASWSPQQLKDRAPLLQQLGVLFIEQPLHPQAVLPEGVDIPIFADESCVIESDLIHLPERFAGINIKLVKCGGLTPALRMLDLAQKLGKMRMVGCMIESGILISAGAAIAQRCDYVDLDGAWLLANETRGEWALSKGLLSLREKNFAPMGYEKTRNS